MFKYIKYFFHFFTYCRFVYKNRSYFYTKYGLSYNIFFELFTTIDVSEAPEENVNKYGSLVLLEHEIRKYIKQLNADLDRFGMNEYFKTIEIKPLHKSAVGVAFGYKMFSNRRVYAALLGMLILLASLLTFLII